MKSKLEALLAAQMAAVPIGFTAQYRFMPSRKWAADFFVPFDIGQPHGVLVQIDGGGGAGGHGTSKGIRLACERDSAAACAGYRVIRCDATQVKSGEALRWILCALRIEGEPEAVFARQRRPKSPTGSHRARGLGVADLPPRVRKAAGLA